MIQRQLELDHEGEAGALGDVIVISRHLINRVREIADNWDPITLYTFYYYTAKWQKSNIAKATTAYAAKGLRWSIERVRKNKNVLKELNLIEDVTRRTDKGKVTGHFVRVCFIWAAKNHPTEKPGGGVNQGVDMTTPNALSKSKGNALSKNKINASHNALRINWEFVKDEWNRLAIQNGLPGISKMTDGRKAKYKARTEKGKTEDVFWQIIELQLPRLADWALGQTERKWCIDFDHIVKSDEILTKLEEGKYNQNRIPKTAKKKVPQGRRLDLLTREQALLEE